MSECVEHAMEFCRAAAATFVRDGKMQLRTVGIARGRA